MICRAIVLFIFCLSCSLTADYSWQRSPAEPIVEKGVNALYNYKFSQAITLLDSARIIDPHHPLVPFVRIAAKWLHTQVNSGYAASYEMILEETKAAIPVYENLITQFPQDPEYYLYLGSTYGIRARIALANKDWLDVLYNGYQGLKHIRKAKDMDDMLMDVYMPMGIMSYFTCMSPAPIQWAAAIVDLSSRCEVGLAQLNIAAEKSHYSWMEASNVLSYAYLHLERDYENARRIILPLSKQFPGHPFFAFLKGELLAKTERWEALNEFLPQLEIFARNGPFLQQNECQLKLAYIKGIKAFKTGDYEESIRQTTWMLENYHMEFDWLKGFAYLLRGQSYEAIGEFGLANVDYKEVLNMDSYYPEVEKAKENIEKITNEE